MYQYSNEDVAFERLKDLQRELENARLMAGGASEIARLARNVIARAWWLAGLAIRRAPRRRPLAQLEAREKTATS